MFCKTVWNAIHILPDGYIRLCSIGANSNPLLDLQRARDKNGNVMHILTHDLSEIMNSDKHKAVRLKNLSDPTGWSAHCDCCENREKIINFDRNHPNKSRRMYLMRMDTDHIVNEFNFKDKVSSTGEVSWMPNSLDIRFGNLCNQKCVMCNPTFSNLWYDEYFEYYNTNKFGQGEKISIVKNPSTNKWITPDELRWFENPIWWEKFEQMAPHLKHIYITGGEPMVAPAHDEMLDRLISSGYAKNIWLEYDTNCTTVNDKIAERWYHFKKVDLRGSMDAIESQYELIRFGGKWDKFVKNVKKLKEYEKDSNGKISLLSLSTCFQILTSLNILESEEWCKSIDVEFTMRFLEGPAHLSVASFSDSLKMELIDYYNRYPESEKARIIVNHLKNHLGSKFYKKNIHNEFYRYMEFLDKNRNTNWKEVFPEVYNLIRNHEILL